MAKAMAMVSLDTDCMMADVMGMFMESFGSSPFLNFTKGVRRDTFAGMHCSEE